MVYAGGGLTTSIKITSATIGGTTSSIPAPVSFNKQLEPGKSYTLRVSFKTLQWAYSNIYWDATTDASNPKLTFDTTDKGNQGYQGVYFKFGSLVGVSPAGVNYDDNTVLYVPYGYPSAPKWKERKRTQVKADTDIPEATENWTSWGLSTYTAYDIPYLDRSYPRINIESFAIDADQNTQARYQSLRGDICQYLSKTGAVSGNYRLPMRNECGTATTPWNSSSPTTIPVAGGWLKGTGSFTENNAVGYSNGRADLLSSVMENNFVLGKNSHASNTTVFGSAKNTLMGNVTLSATGYRNTSSEGILRSVGIQGEYWSGSADNSMSYGPYFTSGSMGPLGGGVASYGYAVRCVKN
jgi:hypothetical protein